LTDGLTRRSLRKIETTAAVYIFMSLRHIKSFQELSSALADVLSAHNIHESHGHGHALQVYAHALAAFDSSPYSPDENIRNIVGAAALLHDADDRKFFHHQNNENARVILAAAADEYSCEDVETVVSSIGLVSASKNHDSVSQQLPEWMYYPRWADRLTAIGHEGLVRCYDYTRHDGRPLATPATKKARTQEELWKIASPERYANYAGVSESMIDHMYDKLLRAGLALTEVGNDYIKNKAKKRLDVMVSYLLMYGVTGYALNPSSLSLAGDE